MAIRLAPATPYTVAPRHGAFILYAGGTALAIADTREEAEQVERAFELVLAPRFTRDEAIAIVKAALPAVLTQGGTCSSEAHGARLALEALAAAGAFSDGHLCPCEQTDCPATMAAKLDAAGIR